MNPTSKIQSFQCFSNHSFIPETWPKPVDYRFPRSNITMPPCRDGVFHSWLPPSSKCSKFPDFSKDSQHWPDVATANTWISPQPVDYWINGDSRCPISSRRQKSIVQVGCHPSQFQKSSCHHSQFVASKLENLADDNHPKVVTLVFFVESVG